MSVNVQGKRITVFGLAQSGMAVLRLLHEHGAILKGSDSQPLEKLTGVAEELSQNGIEFVPQTPAALDGCEIAVLSPGVSPWQPLFDEARARGVKLVGDVEAASWFLRGPILGITGSNGKTTTTSLAGHLLAEAAIASQVGGNIGKPVASMVAASRDEQWNVLELSSFQLEMADTLHVNIAAILNITPDHLDRHGNFENYAEAKARILRHQTPRDRAILNAENEPAAALAGRTDAVVFWFNAGGPVARGFWREGADLLAEGSRFMPVSEVPLRGRHNIENVLAAACAAHLAGAPLAAIRRGVASFPGVEHRIEFVRAVGGVDYFNDSKATNVDATIKALESFDGGLWVILGGKDKDSDYTPLRDLLKERARAALLIGAAAEKIAAHLGDCVRIEQCGDLATAVRLAHREARPGDTVLLAPSCASFDQFTGYAHRGRVFKELVAALGVN
jgi:UDP-N-acetylmuramoylalanine--D-glutamate ligase